MDKTYAETQGEAPFDWRVFITRAIEGDVNQTEHCVALSLAKNWVTCACGNQCAIIPRQRTHGNPERMRSAPADEYLHNCGSDFYTALNRHDYTQALDLLNEIEIRSAILIAEELAKLNAK